MTSTQKHKAINLPWGPSSSIPLAFPPEWSVEASWPNLSGAVENYQESLVEALEHPQGESLESLVKPGSKVAIVVDDPSRWTPISDALPIVLARLHALGLGNGDISISAGVGRHHAVDEPAMRKRVGDLVFDSYRCFSPPVDDLSQYVRLGTTPQGVPVRVFQPVASADVRILIGSVLPHLQAGFGGGYKLIFPGCSHRTTLGALHRQGLGGDASKLLGGDPMTNPMRAAIRSAASLLPGHCMSISHLIGEIGQVFRVIAGDVDTVQQDLSTEAKRRFQVPSSAPADIVIAGNDPWPGDPMMSFKVLINHRAAGKPGGILIGYFWTDPDQIDRSFPMKPMRAIASSGKVGAWIARHGLKAADRVTAALGTTSQFMIRWARELVVDRNVMVYAPPLREKLGPRLGPIRLFGDQAEMFAAVQRDLRDTKNPTVRVFPRGGLTYCAG